MSTAIAAYIALADSVAERLALGETVVAVDDFQAVDFWKPKRAIKDVTAPGAPEPFGSHDAPRSAASFKVSRTGGVGSNGWVVP